MGFPHGVRGFLKEVDFIARVKNDVVENIIGPCRDAGKMPIIRRE